MKRFVLILFLLLLLALVAVLSFKMWGEFAITPWAESVDDGMFYPQENETAREMEGKGPESPEHKKGPGHSATRAPSDDGALKLSGPVTVEECASLGSAACTIAMEEDQAFAVNVLKKQLAENPAARRYMKSVVGAMPPFTFVGKVVDGGGAPLSGVEVVYQVGMPYSLGYSRSAYSMTDDDGLFEIRGRAASLLLRRLKKEGYESSSDFADHREFGARPQFGHEPWSTATAQSPRVFTMVPTQP